MEYDAEALLETWLRYQESGAKSDFWAVQAFDELTAPGVGQPSMPKSLPTNRQCVADVQERT